MEPTAGAPWEWQPLPKIRRETKTRIKAKMKQKKEKERKKGQWERGGEWIFSSYKKHSLWVSNEEKDEVFFFKKKSLLLPDSAWTFSPTVSFVKL